MKKHFLSLIVIAMLMHSFDVMGQRRRTYWVDAEAGYSSNWIFNQNAYGNPEMEYATTFGYTGGIGVSYFQDRDWGFKGSLFLSKMGQNYSGVQSVGEAVRKVNLTYLGVPLLIMKNIPYMNYPTWISFGPEVMILLNAKQEYSRVGGNPLPNPIGMASANVKDRFRSTDVALSFALSRMVDINRSKKAMYIFSVNSSFGLTDINKSAWQIPNTHGIYGRSHNFYIGFKAGIMFRVKKFGGLRW